MAFVVRFAPLALEDVELHQQYILQRSNDRTAADAWFAGIFLTAATLQNFPARCPRIPEQARFDIDLHQLLYFSHRLIFHIEGDFVEILRVYHSAARPLRHLDQQAKPGPRLL